MAKELFKEWNPRARAKRLVAQCIPVIDDLRSQGYTLTLRQLYYQLVSRNIIANKEKEYDHLGSVLNRARLAGLVDWDAFEDRGRQPQHPPQFDDVPDLIEAACAWYRLPRWYGQDNYVELWVEKDALAGVLAPIARKYHITLMVNKGYSSVSAMKAAAERFRQYEYGGDDYRDCTLLYLGDLDPSGEDMVKDIRKRMFMFGIHDIDVRKLALTIDQVHQYQPPPNPTKLTDSRAAAYIEEYGYESWEVDALTPQVLNQIISEAIEELLDVDMMNKVMEEEEVDREKLRAAIADLEW